MGKKNHGFCGFNSNQHIYLPVKAYHDKVNILTSITKNQHSYHEDYEYKGHPEEKEHHKVEVNVRWNIKITQDIGQCEDGTEIVNRKTNQECCLDPRSGYLGFVGQQPHAEAEHDDCSATRRY